MHQMVGRGSVHSNMIKDEGVVGVALPPHHAVIIQNFIKQPNITELFSFYLVLVSKNCWGETYVSNFRVSRVSGELISEHITDLYSQWKLKGRTYHQPH